MSNSILIKTVRVNGFRGLKNIEVELEQTTVLTGMNNSGKTSFLKAMQIALGNRQFLSQDDFYIEGNTIGTQIIVDIMIIPNNTDENKNFSEEWEILFTDARIKFTEDSAYIPLRTIASIDPITNNVRIKQYILQEWIELKFGEDPEHHWYELDNGNETSFRFDEIPFFYMDAQRDILEDIKLKSSYIGKMLSKIEYSTEDIAEIEEKIESLNQSAVEKSEILKIIKTALTELNSAMDSTNGGVEITPFTKKIRDLGKGLTISYGDNEDSFLMEYHGMGTRSWSSLLTLKAFVEFFKINSEQNDAVFFPIVAVEEPESHLHPNAQKKLYSQINDIVGQKIISTHSPYIAATAKIEEVRNFYKNEIVECGQINVDELSKEDLRKINRQVINTRGEIFFSKCLVLFEGETEEQALPIFFDKYFGKTSVELGVDFVGVGGYGNYLPFIRFAEYLKIPWIILSDGETPVVKKLKKDIKKVYKLDTVDLSTFTNIFILEDGADFERYLLNEGFIEEIKLAFEKLESVTYLEEELLQKNGTVQKRIKTASTCSDCEQNIYEDILRNYDGDEGFKDFLYDCMTSQKTQFGPVIAETIVASANELPQLIRNLFAKIKNVLNIEEPA